MTAAEILRRATVAETPAFATCGQFRIWRVVDRQTGAHVTVTVDTTPGVLAPAHRVVGLFAWLPSACGGGCTVRDAGISHAPASARTDAHAAYRWARARLQAHVALGETLAPLGVRLPGAADA